MKLKKSFIVVAILLASGGYYWYSRSQTKTSLVRYVTVTAEKGALMTSVAGSGNVAIDQIANVDPTITGTVAGLSVAVGDHVKKGQLLFIIDNDQLGVSVAKSIASLDQSKQAFKSAKVQLKQAKADLSDAKKSGSGKSRAQKDVLNKKVDVAELGIVSAQQDLAASQADYGNQLSIAGKRKVVSPIDGTVNAVNIKNGDDLAKVSSGTSRQTPIIIGDLGTLKAQVEVNEVDIPNVSIGQKAVLKFDAIDGLNISGKIEKMDALGTITQGVVTYKVTIGFDTLDPRIRPEMSVSASLVTDVKQDVIIVPNGAIKTEGTTTYVETLDGQTPKRHTVEVGASNSKETEIISGINAGEKVITQTIDPTKTTTGSSGQPGGFRLFGGGR